MSETMPKFELNSTPRVSATVDHPRLTKFDSAAIRSFFLHYDQYVKEVSARSRQVQSVGSSSESDPIRPVELKFCVDPDWLKSALTMGFIEDCEEYDDLDDDKLRAYLKTKTDKTTDTAIFRV